MKISLVAASCIAMAVSCSAVAQSNGRQAEAAKFVHEFVDRGNAEAKAIAEMEGISVGEATRRLRLERQAANFMAKARARGEAEDFLLALEDGRLAFYRGANSTVSEEAIKAELDSDLRSSVQTKSLRVSPKALKETAESLLPILVQAPGFTGLQIKRKEGEVVILSTSATQTVEFLSTNSVTLPSNVTVQNSAPIVLTATVRGGRPAPYVRGSTCAGGTWGYVVYNTSNQAQKAITTAAHVSEENSRQPLYFPTTSSITDCRSGTAQSYVNGWRGRTDDPNVPRYGVDLSIHRNSSDSYEPYVWTGSAYQPVRYATTPVTGSYLCKFGASTGRTCGTLQDDLIWSNGYGYMSWVKADAGVSLMVAKGDSGGPVWSGITYNDPVGLVHAQWGPTNLLYTEIWNLVERNTGYFVLSAY